MGINDFQVIFIIIEVLFCLLKKIQMILKCNITNYKRFFKLIPFYFIFFINYLDQGLVELDSKKIDRSGFQSFKLRRLFQKKLPIENGIDKKGEQTGYRYLIMELPLERIPIIYEIKEKEIKRQEKVLKIKSYNPEDNSMTETFAMIFNTILLTSPDPYRPMTLEDAKIFSPDGTFLAYLYGQPAGFAALTVEDTEEGKIGVIAGIGVMPKFRGKKVALALTTTIIEWFNKKNVKKLQCEVYEFNDISYNFISSLGFHEVGEMYLDQETVENPLRRFDN
ncbi:MAG: hypothetical protein HeimC3_10470 [Candidatus Heimdallarchaeota archaeon LC_3]|nr:MAG: hypothetical protein HeimC3_10470 [Candidatus Heimdallarchaeota archaeon LC_3]